LSTPALIRKMRFYMGKSAKLFSVSPSLLRRISKAVGFEREMDRLCGSLRVNSSPARERLAWRPLLTVDDELRLTVDAFMANRPR